MTKFGKLFFLLGVIAYACGCSPKIGVTVNVIDRKTQLENQIAGTYTALQDKAWMIASVRSEEGNKEMAGLPPEEKEVYQAVQNRKFNSDDIQEFLGAECVGERRDGLLELRPCQRTKEDGNFDGLVRRLTKEENVDRSTEMKGIILKNASLTDGDLPDIKAALGRKNIEAAEKGWWIQEVDGSWSQKQ